MRSHLSYSRSIAIHQRTLIWSCGGSQTSSLDSFSGMQVAAQDIASSLNSELAALCDTDQTGNAVRGIANDFWLRGYGSFGNQDGRRSSTGSR